ncbi:MAG: recombinase family protein [Patescibacteria group bacterium]
MKKAVLYARVSSALQEKERTIESQIAELKKQIKENNDVLIKEYIDDGYSGAQLDRPGMNKLRDDLKSDLFDTIYFLNTDRIAREVTYQTIIIAEILKYKKQIIINGKDYVHNPENKFALTVLGAVSELERAKIIERSLRGKIHKLKQGQVLNSGANMFGYTYIKRTNKTPAKMIINKDEAKIVKYIYEQYAKGISWKQLIVYLEEKGIKTHLGLKLWDTEKLRHILTNTTYYGIKYFNKTKYEKKPEKSIYKIKYGKRIEKDKSEWIAVKVPAIISKGLFDKVQKRLDKNKKVYKKKSEEQLLSGLIRCGNCGRNYIPYQRYYKYKLVDGSSKITYKVAYHCGLKVKNRMHSKKMDKYLCKNPEVSAPKIEKCVFKMIKDTLLDPDRLLLCTDYMKTKNGLTHEKVENEISDIENSILKITKDKKQYLDDYAKSKITRTLYSKNCSLCEKEIDNLKTQKNQLINKMPRLHKKQVIETSVKQFYEVAKTRFEQATNFNTKREFLLDYIDKIVFLNKKITLYGSLPIKLKAYNDPNQPSKVSKIDFLIEDKIL